MQSCTTVSLRQCELCPRGCKVNREIGQLGICKVSSQLKVARAALHFWEETCISGTKGSGAVFFSGCSMHCVFCQNQEIANGVVGKEISRERLAEILLELQEKGANNINFVTPGHYVPQIIWSVEQAKRQGLRIPIVYNTSGYEKVDTLKQLEGIVDVYLPDFKYWNTELAAKYSNAPDYPEVAKSAIAEMVRQQPEAKFVYDEEQGLELIKKGVIVRQLLLPGQLKDAKQIVKYLHETYGNHIYLSLMSQYTPLAHVEKYPELNRKVSRRSYEAYVDYAIEIGVENGYIQEEDVAEESFIPAFDGEGV
ncbi:MAG: radical SAM protein [Agathobacter sp.]|nr:radical SAM protein [Agathobacter sp.]